jgi:hypothetical protein
MSCPRFTAAARILAMLALFASIVPQASACCCFALSPQLLHCAKDARSCCAPQVQHAGDPAKHRSAKQWAACCQGKTSSSCACSSGKSSCDSQCWCDSCGLEPTEKPAVPAPATNQHVVDVDLALSMPIDIPVSATSSALAFSLTPDAALDHQPPSRQVLFGVWLN